MVAVPSTTVMSPAVRVARCLYGTPASWDSTSRQRSRRPNMPCVQPCDGRRAQRGLHRGPVIPGWRRFAGRHRSPERGPHRGGLPRPADARRRCGGGRWRRPGGVVSPGAAGQSVRNATTVSGSAGRSRFAGDGAPVGEQRPDRGVGPPGAAATVSRLGGSAWSSRTQSPRRVTALPISGAFSRA